MESRVSPAACIRRSVSAWVPDQSLPSTGGADLIISPKCTCLSLICFLVFPSRNSKILKLIRRSPSKRRLSWRRRSVSSGVQGILPSPPVGVSVAFRRFLFLNARCACLSCWERPMAVPKMLGYNSRHIERPAWLPLYTWGCDTPWRAIYIYRCAGVCVYARARVYMYVYNNTNAIFINIIAIFKYL